MITGKDTFRNVTRISRQGFRSLLEKYANPAVVQERGTDEYYDLCLNQHIDPLFILAMFNHESSMGKYGLAATTKSWGNTGFPNFGPQSTGGVSHPVTGKLFPTFRSWRDGLHATLARLNAPDWVYVNRNSIEEIFIHPSGSVWAPIKDRNSPTNYLSKVLAFMNQHQEAKVNVTIERPPVVNSPSPNRGGYSAKHAPRAIVWHITAGLMPGTLGWLRNPDSGASCNYLITKQGIIHELVPPTESAWANGAVNRPNRNNAFVDAVVREGVNFNTRTISIEHEAKAGEAPTRAQELASIYLTAWLCQQFNITPDATHIIRHADIDSVNRPYCPGWPLATLDRMRAAVAERVLAARSTPALSEADRLRRDMEARGFTYDEAFSEGEIVFDHGRERAVVFPHGIWHRFKGNTYKIQHENPHRQDNPLTYEALLRADRVKWFK